MCGRPVDRFLTPNLGEARVGIDDCAGSQQVVGQGCCVDVERRHAAASSTVTTAAFPSRSEEHTSELQSLMRISYAVFCLKKKNKHKNKNYRPRLYKKMIN